MAGTPAVAATAVQALAYVTAILQANVVNGLGEPRELLSRDQHTEQQANVTNPTTQKDVTQ